MAFPSSPKKKLVGLLLVISMLVLLSACGGNKHSSGEVAEPIRIGVITESSGTFQLWGSQELNGLRLGIEYATNGTNTVLGRPIELLIEDTTSNTGVAVQKATKLIEDRKVDILTGTVNSAIALAVMEKAKTSQTPYLISCAAADSITGENYNDYTFRVGRSTKQATMAAAESLTKLGKTFYIISPDYAGGKDFVKAWEDDIVANGGEVVGKVFAPVDATDFTTYLQKIKSVQPDVLVIVLVGNNYSIKLPQQIRELGLADEMKIAGDLADKEFLVGLGEAGVGFVGPILYYYSVFDTPENKYLVEKHKQNYGLEPDLWSGNGFSGGIALVKALEKAGSTDKEAIRKAFEGLKFNGTSGEIYIRPEDHQAVQNIAVVELKMKDKDYPEPTLLELVTQIEPPITVKK